MKYKKLFTVLVTTILSMGILTGCGSDENKPWDPTMDITIVSREDGSGTRGAFVELFEIEEEDASGEVFDMTTDEAQITNNTAVMMTTVAGDEYAIGYISLGSLNDTVRPVKIDGIEPTAENIKNGKYKVSRPFVIATKEGNENPAMDAFISFIMSKEGQAVVTENGYISNDDAKPFEGSDEAGKVVVGGSSSVSPVIEKMIEAYKEINPNANIELQATDSTTGVISAIDGSYDIGLASRSLKENEIEQGLKAQIAAMDGIVIVTNHDSEIHELSSEQVQKIYKGGAYTWSEVLE